MDNTGKGHEFCAETENVSQDNVGSVFVRRAALIRNFREIIQNPPTLWGVGLM